MKAGRLILVFLFLILGSAVAQLGLPTTNVSGGFKPPPLESIEATQTNRDIDRIIIFLTTPLESNRSIEATQTNHKLTKTNCFDQFDAPPAKNPYADMVDTGENPYTKLAPPVKAQKADDFLNQFDTPKSLSADKFLDQTNDLGFVPDKTPDLGFVPDKKFTQPPLDLKPSGTSLRISTRKVPTSSEKSDAALQIQRAEYERWLEQLKQEQALKDIAWQLELLRYQQEDEAMRQRISSLPVLPISVAPPLDPIRIAKEYDLPVLPISVAPPVVVSPNSYDPNSLANPYGAGSPYKADGLMNPYSQYGSPYSSKSWRNPYATDAPKLYDSQGNYRGKLSANPYDPDSTANPYGRYGSPYSSESINNPYGLGSPYNTTPIYVVPSP
jgi:hypothetical protein